MQSHYLYTLCMERSVLVPAAYLDEFLAECSNNDISAKEETSENGNKRFTIATPISKEEAIVIAKHRHLEWEVKERLEKGDSPYEALAEWDLI